VDQESIVTHLHRGFRIDGRSREAGGMPEGRFYWMMIDSERQPDGRARLMYDATRRWSEGEKVACRFS
jgi:hypothetical protein